MLCEFNVLEMALLNAVGCFQATAASFNMRGSH